jgi:5-methyltetrahydrofolate--homocysteine methyltransferase
VLATVEGDLHDLGKNVVVTMLRSNGYKVFDLGKNVPLQAIIEAVEREKAEIVGLSALMTGTMITMGEDVAALRSMFPDLKLTVGGAAVSQDFSRRIGADGYAPDAPSAVRLVNDLMKGS